MQKKVFQLALSLFLSISAFSQTVKITGNIRSKSQALSSATIQLKSILEQDLLFYGSSGDSGNYVISGSLDKSDKFILVASFIGFKRDTIIIPRSELLKSIAHTYNFSLVEDTKQLEEIYVKAPPAIVTNDDTTKYDVRRFTSPDDKNLESVIKKMPGMDVSRDGTISFKGKKINKILLEGDDLTGEGYKAITRNLKPELVEEVQAIEHYVEDNLLQGIINSDDIVLNLTIKDKKAKKVLGSVDASIGTNDRRQLSSNLISFIDRTKAFSFINHGNISNQGNDIYAPGDESKGFDGRYEIIKHETGTYNPFDGSLYTINNTTQGSLSAITRISDKFKINYSLYYLWNKLQAQTFSQSTFFPPTSISTEDSDNRNSLNKTTKADFSFDYLVNKNARLWGKFAYKRDPKIFNSDAFSTFNDIAGDSVKQRQDDVNEKFNGQLKYTVKVDSKTAYLLSANILVNKLSQNYNVVSRLYEDVPTLNGASNLLQELDNKTFKLKLDFEGLKRYRNSFFYLNVGNENNQSRLHSNLFSENQNVKTSVGPDFINDNLFKINQSYVTGKYVFDKQSIKIQAQLKSTLQLLNYRRKDSTLVILEPSVSFIYKISEIQSLSFNYNFKNTNPEPIEYYENNVLTDIRNFNSGLTNFYNFNTHILGLNYSFNDFSNSYFSVNASANGSYSKNGFLYTNIFLDQLSYTKKEAYKGVKTFNTNLNAKKFLPFLSLYLTTSYSPSFSTYFSNIGNEVKEFSLLSQSMMFKINTGFNLPINFALSTEIQTNRTNSEGNLIAKNRAINYTLEYRYKITKELFNVSSMDMYRVNGGKFDLIDTELQYNPSKGLFHYSLQGKNLANVKSFTSLNINETYSSINSSSIFGRYILLSVSMSIK